MFAASSRFRAPSLPGSRLGGRSRARSGRARAQPFRSVPVGHEPQGLDHGDPAQFLFQRDAAPEASVPAGRRGAVGHGNCKRRPGGAGRNARSGAGFRNAARGAAGSAGAGGRKWLLLRGRSAYRGVRSRHDEEPGVARAARARSALGRQGWRRYPWTRLGPSMRSTSIAADPVAQRATGLRRSEKSSVSPRAAGNPFRGSCLIWLCGQGLAPSGCLRRAAHRDDCDACLRPRISLTWPLRGTARWARGRGRLPRGNRAMARQAPGEGRRRRRVPHGAMDASAGASARSTTMPAYPSCARSIRHTQASPFRRGFLPS